MSRLSLTTDVYEQLKDQILRVERSPGDVIYEAELADQFGVSKTPVREALGLLAHAGWVVVLPRKGYIVRPLELSDVREIYAIRRAFEPGLASDAAKSATKMTLATLDDLVDQQASGGDGLKHALSAARSFHLALVDLGGSRRLRAILETLVDEVQRLHYLLPNVEEHIHSAEELQAHRSITTAIRKRQPERAEKLMLEHLNEVARTLIKGFSGL